MYKHLKPFGYPLVKTNNTPLPDLEPSSPVINSPEAETRIHEPVKNELPNKEEISPIKEPQNTKKKHYQWISENCPPPKEIHGEVGDPQKIIDSNQRQRHTASYAMHSLHEDPKTYQQAMNCNFSDDWSKAIQTKLENMEKHCQKTDEDGNLRKLEAFLCVQGFHQREGIDYGDVFSPTGRLTSLHLLLMLCHINKFTIEQMDIKCAFLNGKPDKDLYIKRPNRYKKFEPTK
ncbi:hypothetical protein O181_044622 [Austropuccinia psidii MF-1]|uniref:Reverse transcriptase Ty1/copia-type domain-containing protein n=1 Tax=Austropuccinia psidii MF-1 TaxID=1389203 RepID=A0A9Q3DMT0_9BASI|nr:hypothetical protein [Austropuccinia psidii MF-1]